MAAKPWENRLMEEINTNSSEATFSRKSEDNIGGFYSSKSNSVKVRKNNVTTKVLAKPPVACHTTRSFSAPSSASFNDEYSVSTSSTSASPIPLSSNTSGEENYSQKHVLLNKSTQANKMTCSSHNMQRHTMEDQFPMKSTALSNGDTKSSAGSKPSFNLCRDLYPPLPLGRHDEIRNRHH